MRKALSLLITIVMVFGCFNSVSFADSEISLENFIVIDKKIYYKDDINTPIFEKNVEDFCIDEHRRKISVLTLENGDSAWYKSDLCNGNFS